MGYAPIKQETQEQYLRIWTEYVMTSESQESLAVVFGCSMDTIYNALAWVAGHRTQFKSSVLIEIAKATIENKLRRLNDDLSNLKKKEEINWNWIVGLEKLIFSYMELLWKFQGVLYDRNVIQINASVPPPEIQMLHNLTEEIKSYQMTQEERNAIADILRKTGENRRTIDAILKKAVERRDNKEQVNAKEVLGNA